jgi:hypothetical protein
LSLNKEETLSVISLKTFFNNPEVELHQRTGGLKANVCVLSIKGSPLMPCSASKARKLLRADKAKVKTIFPFTIKLNFECENQTQNITFGVDSGYVNVGFSAVTDKKELVSGTVFLDDKTSSRLNEKKMYRVGRRSRLWYRKPRFLNKKKKIGALSPSNKRRYNAHLKLINLYKSLLPITNVVIETANFDIQKINNTNIYSQEYQQGSMYGYQNMRSYLISRESGKCQICFKEFSKRNPSHIHHIVERSKGGTNMSKNLAILHKKCHENLHKKGVRLSPNKSFKAETFMSSIESGFIKDIPNVKITFGYKTFVDRNKIGLKKTHYNDAFVISGGSTQERTFPIVIKQKRRNSRSIQLNRKGFKPSIRKNRYPIQPKDLIWIDGKRYVASGTHNNGNRVVVEGTKKSYLVKKVQRIYSFGSFAFI